MDICFEGIGQMVATFAAGKALTPGMAVTLTGNGEVGLSGGDDSLCGVTVGAERGGAVAVQIGGVVKVGYSGGEAPSAGWKELACDGNGGVKTKAGGTKCLVLAADEESVIIKL